MNFFISNFVCNCALLLTCINAVTSSDTSSASNLSFIEPINVDTSLDVETLKYDPCIIEKNGHIYDLRSLSMKKYWFYSEPTHNDSELVFYISLCHPVQDVPSCNSNDGVCFSYVDYSKDHDITSIKFASGGKISENKFTPELMQEGSLRYVYENGSICKRGSLELPYKTELHLQCPISSEDETSSPILMASPRCLFIFVWMTLAACPKTIKKFDDPCIIQFADSEYPLNLHSLQSKTFYKATGDNYAFEFNICGPVVNGSCKGNEDVCDITVPDNPVAIIEHSETSMSFKWEEKYLILSYKGYKNKDNFTIDIKINCDRVAYTPKFYFASKNPNVYVFTMYTVNVCNPKMSDCVIEDKKMNVFDLRPLHKKEGNWEVIGRTNNEIHNLALYYINMCGPVNDNQFNKCPSGPVGACQPSLSVSGSKNLGFITSHPIVNVNNDESLTVLYTGGDPCNEGKFSSSTRINLICSQTEYSPAFIRVTESCEHIIEWHTPAACPVNVVTGSNCRVVDPLFGHNFDLNPLRNDTADYQTTNGDNKFLVNICGPLVSSCTGQKNNTAICQLGDKEKSGGVVPAELIFNDGSLIMRFSNGSFGCDEGQWTSQILFLCSHAEEGSEGLQYIHADDSACVHHFIWHTKYACPPHLELNCSVTDGDLLYDLTPLSNPNINEIFITYDGTKKYVINVCRSVIHSKESRCSYDAGACLIDLSHENKTRNLGFVKSGPYIEDKHLRIKYENGDKCNSTHNYQTIIEFECTDEEYLSYPVLQAEEDCLVSFLWSSLYSCPQNLSVPANEDEGEGNCTAINPQSKYIFDMTELKNVTPWELPISERTTLLISACGKISDSRCRDSISGACIVNSSGLSRSAGNANSLLQYHMWSTYLEYKGGEPCRENGLKRSTKISFICQEKGFPSGPVLISDDRESCSFFVHWYTELACERHISCFANSWEHTFDLSPLVKVWGNYEVTDPENMNNTYLLNVCRPLNPVIGVNCHAGSSACLVRRNKIPLSLGHPILNPVVVKQVEAHLMYAHGSQCPDGGGITLSSRIIFICNRSAGAGEPVFYRKTHDCQIQFKWYTSYVCPPVPLEEQHCQIAFEAAKTNVDLSPLKRTLPYKVFYRGQTFLINLCGASVCNNSAVCTENDNVSYGLSSHSKLQWDYNALVMKFYSGSPCKSSLTGFRTSEIYFECEPSVGLGMPEPSHIMYGLNCTSVFYWRTNLTCLESIYKPSGSDLPTTVVPKYIDTPIITSETILSTEQPESNAVTQSVDSNKLESHTWVSVMIAALVMISVVAAVVFVVGRSSHGRRLYAHAKRTLARKGDQAYIMDDHL